MSDLTKRFDRVDWDDVNAQLDEKGYALTGEVLSETACY
jgi:hypothetical protein